MNFFQYRNKFVGQLQRLFVPNEMCRRVRISVLEDEPLLLRPQDGQLVGKEADPFGHPLCRMVDPTRGGQHADFFRLKLGGQQPLAVVVAQQGIVVSSLVVQDLGEDCRLLKKIKFKTFQFVFRKLSVK